MKKHFLTVLCLIIAPLYGFASNEGVPTFYNQNGITNANRNAYTKYQKYGYTDYVGNSGTRQIVSSNQYSYKVPRAKAVPYDGTYNGAMTTNGIGLPTSNYRTAVYANYARVFADFEFETGVNSVLEWDDMIFNEINVGLRHVFDLHGFDLLAYGDYTYGKMSKGGLSMDYDLEPYDYAYPEDGIFTISMGGQSGDINKLKLGIGAHHIWDFNGWKITPHIGYEIFKHNLEMDNHIYPNPGVYLPLMTNGGDYVFYDTVDNQYWAISPNNVSNYDENIFYQVCMSPEDLKIVYTSVSNGAFATSFTTSDYDPTLNTVPWGVGPGDCVVIGGDGVIKVDGTTHIYNTTWSGFYLGLEVEKQMTLADKLRFYVQVSMPKYSSEGIWPNRDDWQQSPSFLDEGTNGAFAYEAEMEYAYQISDRLQLSLKANTNYFHIGSIPGELYVAKQTYYEEDPNQTGNWIIVEEPAYTEYVSESLKRATWQSFGLYIGIKYAF